ncbi:MAG: hypothetical protein ABSF08_07075 [Candidatus Cybelea sp.]
MKVVVELQGQRLEFNLDNGARRWVPIEPATSSLLHEGEFPLVAYADGKRYELYSDGSFDEVEL